MTWNLYSPSSLSAIDLCPRIFAWDKVDKVERGSNHYHEFGIKVHSHIESYYKRGVMPDIASPEGNCAIALLSHLPPPQPGIIVEEDYSCGRFHGIPDLMLDHRVWDHKTTSSLNWAKTPEALSTDLQACIYAYFSMSRSKENKAILQWNYVTRDKRPQVRPVVLRATPPMIQPTLDRASRLADVGDIILSRQLHALEIPPNPVACDAFGGCQHRSRCNLTSSERMEGLMNMTQAADFLAAMSAAHPPSPAIGAGGANPWDALPATHQTPTQWYDGASWRDKVPAAQLHGPPPPPPPPSAPPAINPPPVAPAPPTAAAPPTPPAPPPPPAPRPPAPPTTAVIEHAPVGDNPHEMLARALEDAADAIRLLAPEPKRGPGRPRKPKTEM